MKVKIYLDTSVFSAYHDDAVKERQDLTVDFWNRRSEFELSTSALAIQELEDTPDVTKRDLFKVLTKGLFIHPVTEEAKVLGMQYITKGVFTEAMKDDSVHVAIAVLNRQDILLSWNFKHLVNRRRRANINDINISLGLPQIEILAPPEV